MATSIEFVTSSEMDMAWDDVKHEGGPVRLETRIGGQGTWRPVDGVASLAAARRWVRGLDGAPRPGRFRLVKGDA